MTRCGIKVMASTGIKRTERHQAYGGSA